MTIGTISPSHSPRYFSTYTNPNFTTNANKPIKNLFDLFDELLHTTPMPPIERFNKLFIEIAKMKHFSTSLSLIRQLFDLLHIKTLRPDFEDCGEFKLEIAEPMMKVPWSSVNPYSLSFSREHG
jgi:hypothetical protein